MVSPRSRGAWLGSLGKVVHLPALSWGAATPPESSVWRQRPYGGAVAGTAPCLHRHCSLQAVRPWKWLWLCEWGRNATSRPRLSEKPETAASAPRLTRGQALPMTSQRPPTVLRLESRPSLSLGAHSAGTPPASPGPTEAGRCLSAHQDGE